MHVFRLFSSIIWSVSLILWPSLFCAQTTVSWPIDVHASCEEDLEEFAEAPLVTLGASLRKASLTMWMCCWKSNVLKTPWLIGRGQ